MSNAEAHKPVEVIGLGKKFGDVIAVEAINFAVERGRVIGLLGGNGAGKTTTMSMLMGLLTPTSGIARIFGKNASTRDASALARINFSSPYVEMPGRLTVAENLEVYARLFGLRRPKDRIAKLARDLDLAVEDLRYRAAGINHMAFYLDLSAKQKDGSYGNLYPALQRGYHTGRLPSTTGNNPRCHNYVRYEVMKQFGYFVTESSEHFAEYVPWFIKSHRPDLIDTFKIPLDEYPKRCEEQIADWGQQAKAYRDTEQIKVTQSHEYAAQIMNALQGGTACTIYGNMANKGLIPQLPEGAAVEVPCRVDGKGLHPEPVHDIPPQLIAMMRTNVNVQELTVHALLMENRDHIYHAAMLDPRTAAELDLGQIRRLVDDLLTAHEKWLPHWLNTATAA